MAFRQHYVGIDPGVSGGVACITVTYPTHPESDPIPSRKLSVMSLPAALTDLKLWLERQCDAGGIGGLVNPPYVVVERQYPRPTAWEDKEAGIVKSSVLKSTCTLYGSYREILGLLIGMGLVHRRHWLDVDPRTWQGTFGLNIEPRKTHIRNIRRRSRPRGIPKILEEEYTEREHVGGNALGEETRTEWKRRLRDYARDLFPAHRKEIILSTCDAVLLAEYCRRIEGR